jgi:hypothetical protein
MGFEVLAPLAVGLVVADRREELLQPSPTHANCYSSQAWTTVCWEILPPLSSSMAMQNTFAPSG